KALEKDRTRRYETANGLARDLQHYLADEPVEACPPSPGYKLRKFARKNRKLLATAAAFAVLPFVGVAASSWAAGRATQAGAAANASAAEAEEKEREANRFNEKLQGTLEQLRATQTRLQRTLYASHMNQAQLAWDAGGIGRVRELLEQHRPKPGESDLR